MAINPTTLALPPGKRPTVSNSRKPAVVKAAIKGRFLKGPIPLIWLIKASCLPGRTLEVAIVLWFLSGVKKSKVIALPNKILSEFGVDRYAKKRALDRLEEAGLVSVSQSTGRSPIVTILEISNDD